MLHVGAVTQGRPLAHCRSCFLKACTHCVALQEAGLQATALLCGWLKLMSPHTNVCVLPRIIVLTETRICLSQPTPARLKVHATDAPCAVA